MKRTSVSCKDTKRLIIFAHNYMRLLNSKQTLGEVLDEIENAKGGGSMKCKSCGHDVETIRLDRTTVQAVMLKKPCCEAPDYDVEPTEEEMFEYLDELKDRGAVNMVGASPYLIVEFHLNKGEARKVLADWMRTFHTRLP